MSTIRRRDLRPRPLSKSAERLLAAARRRGGHVGFPRELIADAGVAPSLAWPAITQLLERGLLATNALGHLQVTPAGRKIGLRAA